MSRIFHDYGLGIALFVVFLLSWGGQLVFQWQVFVNDSESHNEQPEVGKFAPEFLASTFENWQSEFLQLASMVFLTAYLIYKGSPQSKDSDEKTERRLRLIEKKLDRLIRRKKWAR